MRQRSSLFLCIFCPSESYSSGLHAAFEFRPFSASRVGSLFRKSSTACSQYSGRAFSGNLYRNETLYAMNIKSGPAIAAGNIF